MATPATVVRYQARAREKGQCIFCHCRARIKKNGQKAQTCPACYQKQLARAKLARLKP